MLVKKTMTTLIGTGIAALTLVAGLSVQPAAASTTLPASSLRARLMFDSDHDSWRDRWQQSQHRDYWRDSHDRDSRRWHRDDARRDRDDFRFRWDRDDRHRDRDDFRNHRRGDRDDSRRDWRDHR